MFFMSDVYASAFRAGPAADARYLGLLELASMVSGAALLAGAPILVRDADQDGRACQQGCAGNHRRQFQQAEVACVRRGPRPKRRGVDITHEEHEGVADRRLRPPVAQVSKREK